jgi:hypothetical protein
MPIRLEGLDADEKAHVAVKANATWLICAAALKQRAGNTFWPLVVRKSDGAYLAARFKTILDSGGVQPDTPAEALPGLAAVETLAISTMSTAAARDHVNGLAGLKLVVLVDDDGRFVGTLSQGIHRGDLPGGKLEGLTSGPVDLSTLKDFLLDE